MFINKIYQPLCTVDFKILLIYLCEHASLYTPTNKRGWHLSSASACPDSAPAEAPLTSSSIPFGEWSKHVGGSWESPQEFGGSAWIAVAQEVGAPLGKEVGGEGSLQEPKGETALHLENPHQGGAWGNGKPRLPSPWDPPTDLSSNWGTRPNESKNKAVFPLLPGYTVFTASSSHLNRKELNITHFCQLQAAGVGGTTGEQTKPHPIPWLGSLVWWLWRSDLKHIHDWNFKLHSTFFLSSPKWLVSYRMCLLLRYSPPSGKVTAGTAQSKALDRSIK